MLREPLVVNVFRTVTRVWRQCSMVVPKAAAVGLKVFGEKRVDDLVGRAAPDLTIVNGRRQSAADAYLTPALARPNLDIVAEAMVHRVLLAGARAIGIEYRTSAGELVTERAAEEVVLAAGAIGPFPATTNARPSD
jgi:choline dehydrogenase